MEELKFSITPQAGAVGADFEELKSRLAEKMEGYRLKEFTEDRKAEAKRDLAGLRKARSSIKSRVSEAKAEYMKPFNAFEEQVKELLGLIDEPILLIDGQVKEFEDRRIKQRKEDIEESYGETVPEEMQDYMPLECIYGDKWLNAGTTMKSIRKEMERIADATKSELSAIRAMNSDKEEEALNIYMAGRSLPAAMKFIADWEAKKQEILRARAEEEARREESMRQAEEERIRKEERERIREEERIRQAAKEEAIEGLKAVDEAAAAPLSGEESRKVLYTVVATAEELEGIEMALTSLGVYFERKDV